MAIINLNAAAYRYLEQRERARHREQGERALSKRCPHCFSFLTEKNDERVCSNPRTNCKK